MEKRRNFSSFPRYFQYISNVRSQITYSFVNCDCSIYFFLNSANLICRGTDISKHFWESLGLRVNESLLYSCSWNNKPFWVSWNRRLHKHRRLTMYFIEVEFDRNVIKVRRDMCGKRRLGSDCASAQSDPSLRSSLGETLHPWLSRMRQIKILIRLHECAG